MASRTLSATAVLAVLLPVLLTGCAKHPGRIAPTITDPVVFDETFAAGEDFQAFLGSKLDAIAIDSTEHHAGAASIRVTVPNPGDPSGTYAGGAFTTTRARDLSPYDALTFWAKASRPITLDIAGLGNDNTGRSKFQASRANIPLSMTWTKYTIPIPVPRKVTSEQGLFFFAEGPENGAGSTIWFDEIQFERLGTIGNPRPTIPTLSLSPDVGTSITIPNTKVTFSVDGADVPLDAMPAYFDFLSTDESVARPGLGVIDILALGTAQITAKLDTVTATGVVTLTTNAAPTTAAPTPTVPAADVIALFSNAYVQVPVDTWSTSWDVADVSDVRIAGNDVKKYSNLVFAGIEFTSAPIDASAMTHFHLDVWMPRGTVFRVKLVDFGPNGVYGGDDSEHELTINASSTPALVTGSWLSLDLPLASFTNLASRAHLAQLILSGDPGTVYVDNVYFHR